MFRGILIESVIFKVLLNLPKGPSFPTPCDPALPSYDPSFFEVYGQGNLVRAAHGCRSRSLCYGSSRLQARLRKMEFLQGPGSEIGAAYGFSLWNQDINHKRIPARIEERRKEAVMHLHFVVSLYKLQTDAGRHFLHEHPAGASNWRDPWIERMLKV